MESSYLLLILSGLTIVLLGFLLLFAEREIRRKRREIEEIKRRRNAVLNPDSGACDRCPQLEAELAEYRQQLEHSQMRMSEVERAQQRSTSDGSCAMTDPEQQRKLEELIADLERELAEGKSQAAALEETHERLRETERVCSELAAENHRLREEIAHWEGRFAASEENQRHAESLRQQLAALQAGHTPAIENDRQMQERPGSAGAGGPALAPERNGFQGRAILSGMMRSMKAWAVRMSESRKSPAASHPTDSASGIHEGQATEASWRSIVRNRPMGAALAGVAILAIAGAVTMVSRSADAPESSDSLVFAPEANSAEPDVPSTEKTSAKPASRLRGAFQTVRPTQVYSGPSENSALVANIGAGMRLNVVDSQKGWLEVRSKHGRPPGFVRQDAAVRVGSN